MDYVVVVIAIGSVAYILHYFYVQTPWGRRKPESLPSLFAIVMVASVIVLTVIGIFFPRD